jgi:hypothetical protein
MCLSSILEAPYAAVCVSGKPCAFPREWDKVLMAGRTHGHPLSLSFIRHLLEDVIAARQRLKQSDTQAARRDVVRASLAAVEGAVWVAREHVRSALSSLDELTPVADLALRERSYAVSRSGKIEEQVRGLPLTTAVRLVISQAEAACPQMSVDFSVGGWSDLHRAIEIRNRITHPKPHVDLQVTDDDLGMVQSAVSWLLRTMNDVMDSINVTLVQYNDDMRELLRGLRAGDPDILAEYEAAGREVDSEDTP